MKLWDALKQALCDASPKYARTLAGILRQSRAGRPKNDVQRAYYLIAQFRFLGVNDNIGEPAQPLI